MDAVEAVGVHVVREAAGTADARDEDEVFSRRAQLRHQLLHLSENSVVATAGTPTYILIGDEILACQLGLATGLDVCALLSVFCALYCGGHLPYASRMRLMRVVISETLNG